jgi:hypothetical protein
MRILDPFYYTERKNQPQGGGKGGGGGGDADAMLAYGQKGLDLQEKIYKENKADAQPWYQTGTAAVGQLGKLMGLNGTSANANPSTRQGLIDQYKGQFTTSNTTANAGPEQYVGPDGSVYFGSLNDAKNQYGQKTNFKPYEANAFQRLNGAPQTTTTTDQAALNKYVDDLIAKQGAANESDPAFGSLAKNFGMDDFQTDPGYQFRLAEGQKALERKLNASGKTFSPEAAKALLGYNQDMGTNEYNNAYNRFNIDQDNLFNRLATLSGFGQTASGQIANAGTNYANAATEQYNGMGNAVTSANLANKANNSSMFGSLLGAGAKLGSAWLSSDERLKENIEYIGTEKGHKLYKFNYINIPEKTYVGVMAQDVEKYAPDAVLETEGYKRVNYDMLGIRMVEVMKDGASCH